MWSKGVVALLIIFGMACGHPSTTPTQFLPPPPEINFLEPEHAILKLEIISEDGEQFFCTAVMIGPKRAATAGHCVEDFISAAYISAIPHADLDLNPVEVLRWEAEDCFSEDQLTCDLAVLVFEQPLGLETGWMVPTAPSEVGDKVYRLVGYPGGSFLMTSGSGRLWDHGDINWHIMPTYGGMSGGPIFFHHQLVGIATRGFPEGKEGGPNVGVSLNKKKIKFLWEAARD